MSDTRVVEYEIDYIVVGAIKRPRARALLDSVGATYVEDRSALGSRFLDIRGETSADRYAILMDAFANLSRR